MAVRGTVEEGIYATLLLSDTYLPGALVLAHSLRDAVTQRKLAVLVILDSVSAEAITQLQAVYDHVIPVPRIKTTQPDNLQLMNRTDLHSAFTKINLWKQTQFSKIVYIDADVVAYRAPDELFDITEPFSAAPDIGWPDLFNTGVMVLTPNMGDYYAMMAMAERNISFDGADQGLLNIHFGSTYNRISFTYNVTPSAHYQYVPAYRHFQSRINMVHFIGSDKPWFQGRHANAGSPGGPYDDMVGRWWAVYDRHYREPAPEARPPTFHQQPSSELVQYLTKGEFKPQFTHIQETGEPYSDRLVGGTIHRHVHDGPPPSHHNSSNFVDPVRHGHGEDQRHHGGGQDHQHQDQPSSSHIENVDQNATDRNDTSDHHDQKEHHDQSIGQAQLHSEQHYEPAPEYPSDPTVSLNISSSLPIQAEGNETEAREEQMHRQGGDPAPPPEPEKPSPFEPTYSSWDAQRAPPPSDSKPEAVGFPSTVYEMSQDSAPFVPPPRYPSPPQNMWYEIPKEPPAAPTEKPKPIFPWEESRRTPPARTFPDDVPSMVQDTFPTSSGDTHEVEPQGESLTEVSVTEASANKEGLEPPTPAIQFTPSSSTWATYTHTNAWDEVPEIEHYVEAVQQTYKRPRNPKAPGPIGMPGAGDGIDTMVGRRGSKLTDFPTETERPSLPVTPAPIRRPILWGGDDEDEARMSGAEGVPEQTDWDPAAQLEKLAKQQAEALLRKLESSRRDSSDLPPRPLPYGSEQLTSPTYVTKMAQQTAPTIVSPQPVKGRTSSIVAAQSAGDRSELTTTGMASTSSSSTSSKAMTTSAKYDVPAPNNDLTQAKQPETIGSRDCR